MANCLDIMSNSSFVLCIIVGLGAATSLARLFSIKTNSISQQMMQQGNLDDPATASKRHVDDYDEYAT